MRCTLNQSPVHIKKLVLLPFQTGACVWALIEISKELAVFMHDENRPVFMTDFYLETFAAGVFNIGCFAENICHNVC